MYLRGLYDFNHFWAQIFIFNLVSGIAKKMSTITDL